MEFLNPKKKQPTSGTQKYLDIAEIHDDVISLNNGSLRMILAVSSLNFELRSTQEQEAIIAQFQNFLNSLEFPIQVVVASRKLNIDPYLKTLHDQERLQENELLQFQISEYIEFIQGLAQKTNIMTKEFYIVVPFYITEEENKGWLKKINTLINPRKQVLEKRESFEAYRAQLEQRVDHVIVGISRTGVSIAPLKTQEIIELLYNSYNPNVFNSILIDKIKDIDVIAK